jgi:hypothetical protein
MTTSRAAAAGKRHTCKPPCLLLVCCLKRQVAAQSSKGCARLCMVPYGSCCCTHSCAMMNAYPVPCSSSCAVGWNQPPKLPACGSLRCPGLQKSIFRPRWGDALVLRCQAEQLRVAPRHRSDWADCWRTVPSTDHPIDRRVVCAYFCSNTKAGR